MDNLESTNSIVIYQTNDGETSIDVKFHDETVWLTQAQMAELFQKDRTVIGRHISNIYKEGELERETTCANLHMWVRTVTNSMLPPYITLMLLYLWVTE